VSRGYARLVMTTCPSCGAPAEAEDRFCARCGTLLGAEVPADPPQSRFCTNCGGPLEEEDRFCGRCGAPVRTTGYVEAEAEVPAVPDDQDFFADWNMVFAEEPPPPTQGAVTEAIPRPASAEAETVSADVDPSDTAVLPPAPTTPPFPTPPEQPRRPAPQGFPWGASVALIGAIAVIVSAVLPWARDGGLPKDIAARTLIDPNSAPSGINLGVVLLVVGTIAALAALLTMVVPWLGFLRRLAGLAALAVPGLFLFRTWEPQLAGGVRTFLDLLQPGVIAAGSGAVVQIVAGKWFRR
jgi:hypothetical protein